MTVVRKWSILLVVVVAVALLLAPTSAFAIQKSLHWPSDSKVVASPFGYAPPNVFTRYGSRLPLPLYRYVAVTITAPSNSPVYATEDGVVKKIFSPAFPYFGNTPYLVVEHTDAVTGAKFTSSYIYVVAAPGLVEGQAVAEGQTIGKVLQPFTGTRDPLPPTGPFIFNVRLAPYAPISYPAYNVYLGTALPQNPKYNPADPHFPELFVDPAAWME